jgi:predicted Fe-S protein YdhL (DUF1289 family)
MSQSPSPIPAPAVQAVPSPCVNVCRMDARTGWCEGCLRTLDEIAGWSKMDGPARRAVWTLLPLRRQRKTAIEQGLD